MRYFLNLRAKLDVVNLDKNTFDINTEFDRKGVGEVEGFNRKQTDTIL